MICPSCGSTTMFMIGNHHYTECGLSNVIVKEVGFHRCKCGEVFYQLPGIAEVHEEIARAILNKKSLLTREEVKFLRKWLGLNSEQLAAILGVTRASVSRWENQLPTPANDRTIRLFVAGARNIPLDAKALFAQVAPTPDKSFKIVIVCTRLPLPLETPSMAKGMLPSTEFRERMGTSSGYKHFFDQEPGNQQLGLVA